MTHNILIDSQYVSNTTTETALDTIVMGANYPTTGKYVITEWGGVVNATSGGAKTFKFRIKKGTTVLDSLTYTTPSGGSSSKDFQIKNTINFKTVGATGRVHSRTSLADENGIIQIIGSYSTVNTTTDNLFILTVEMGTADTGVNIKLDQGYTTTKN
jgi:hypothetical protein